MDLKWFNGSREITDDIVLGSREVQGGLSHDITSTLNIVDTHPSLLTCQAVDQKRRNDEGLFVNVQLKAPGELLYVVFEAFRLNAYEKVQK